ncbi:glycoside hydrolase family 99-like domain-containing protein [Methylomonas montana]|uniref:glycosyltransferase WbsX family protein n=1 Tax=Methylomonas montana TaxID=3058963 RepID=UPI00265B29D1|nr:glycoside hydrolase family 99-like domain-containing protein [Methylomonas montana]WKJ88727.1 glycoside hydrolase family 99-like domain-containing protein [Methylomonas montana]
MSKAARIIAFHLPQFHPTPENDEWWGKGFTEWTNVAKAKPLFAGHYQPHIPADLGFYDLRLPEARHAQSELAKEYGIEGFCYYHYWFGNGRRLLERPVNEILSSGEPDFPFCLCWANHSWNNIWQGVADRMLMEQTYPGMDDHKEHFEWLLNAFKDRRYITVDDMPLFLIFNPGEIPDLPDVLSYWRQLAVEAGLKGLYLVGVNYRFRADWNPRSVGLDASTWQPLPPKDGHIPSNFFGEKIKRFFSKTKSRVTVHHYAAVINMLIRKSPPPFPDYPTVLPNWDNTPRSGENGLVFHESTPELFRSLLRRAFSLIKHYEPEKRIIFIKAWNEWAEGNYLEPDQKYGHGYLQVIKEELGASSLEDNK